MSEAESIGARFKRARKMLGHGQTEVAEALGVPQSNLSPWEKGARPIPHPVLLAMSKVYGVSTLWLEKGVGPFLESELADFTPPLESSETAIRLVILRTSLELSQVDLARQLGVAVTDVKRWESGAVGLPQPTALALEHLFQVNHRWLLADSGMKWLPSRDEGPTSTPDQARLVEETVYCPIIEGDLACGSSGDLNMFGISGAKFPFSREHATALLRSSGGGSEQTLCFARMSGDSMFPTLRDQEFIALNTSIGARNEPVDYAIYLVRDEPGESLCSIRRIRLDRARQTLVKFSDNPSYLPTELPLEGRPIFEMLVARVCWVGRHLHQPEPSQNPWLKAGQAG